MVLKEYPSVWYLGFILACYARSVLISKVDLTILFEIVNSCTVDININA